MITGITSGSAAPRAATTTSVNGERFFITLQDAAPTGVRDVDPVYWTLRLDALRLANRPDQFDEVAIDYCVTFEVSPPSWENSRCKAQLSGSTQNSINIAKAGTLIA